VWGVGSGCLGVRLEKVAVGQDGAAVFEEDHAVAQQGPALLGVRHVDVGSARVRRIGGGATWGVFAHVV
jgi:ABC-type phosphate/phosphonate transport system permease subunit